MSVKGKVTVPTGRSDILAIMKTAETTGNIQLLATHAAASELSPALRRGKGSGVGQMSRDLAVHRFFEVRNSEWFGGVIHRSENKRLFNTFKIIPAGHHDNFCRRADFSGAAKDIEAVESRTQVDVEQHALGLQLFQQTQSFSGRGSENLALEMLLKMFLQQNPKVHFVIYD